MNMVNVQLPFCTYVPWLCIFIVIIAIFGCPNVQNVLGICQSMSALVYQAVIAALSTSLYTLTEIF